MQEGTTLALNQINATGGLNGKCIAVTSVDDQADPTTAAQVGRQLINQDQVKAVVGPMLSGPTGTVLPITKQAGIIEMVESASNQGGDVSAYPGSFETQSTVDVLAKTYVSYLERNHLTKVGELVVNNAFGTELQAAFASAAAGTDLKVVKSLTFTSGTTNLSAQVDEIKASGAQVLASMAAIDPDFIATIKARNNAGWDAPVLGVQSIADAGVVGTLGATAMKSVYAITYKQLGRKPGMSAPVSPTAATFVDKLFAAYPHISLGGSLYQSATAYDAFNMLISAIKVTGGTSAAAITAYLVAHPYQGVAATYSFSSGSHFGVSASALTFALASSAQRGLMELAPGS